MRSRLRVLFICTDLGGGGAERVLLNVIRHLPPERFECSLFLLRKAGAYWSDVPTGVEIHWGVDDAGPIIYRIFPVLQKVIEDAKTHDIIVGALELLPSYVAWVAGAIARKPTLAWVHSYLPQQLGLYRAAWIHHLMIKMIYPHFQKVVFPSTNALEGIQDITRLSSEVCQVIPNPLDLKMLAVRSNEALPNFSEKIFVKPTVLAVGTLTNAIKGFDVLVKAHTVAKRRGCDHNLVILGDGRDRADLLQLANQLQVANSVYLLGFQDNPYPFIRSATAVVVPSRFEAFGMVVAEALAIGTPVIVSSTAKGALEIIENGRYGSTFASGDADALSLKIEAIIEDEKLRSNLRQLGLARAQDFGTERIVAQWERIILQAKN